MVAESIDYLRRHEPEEGYYLGFSGGKDSIVSRALCETAGVKFQAYYSCTRIDPPEVVRFIRENYPDTIFLMPEVTFWAGIKAKMPPLRMARWCCDVLKKQPGISVPLPVRVMGIRAEESARRAARPREDKWKGQTQIKPIFSWKEYHVWDFIETHGLKYPSLYDEGFDRIGCVICPFIMGTTRSKIAKREESMRRWPGMWKAFRHACKEWFDALDPELRPGQKCATFEEYYEAYLNGFE